MAGRILFYPLFCKFASILSSPFSIFIHGFLASDLSSSLIIPYIGLTDVYICHSCTSTSTNRITGGLYPLHSLRTPSTPSTDTRCHCLTTSSHLYSQCSGIYTFHCSPPETSGPYLFTIRACSYPPTPRWRSISTHPHTTHCITFTKHAISARQVVCLISNPPHFTRSHQFPFFILVVLYMDRSRRAILPRA
jgi:hypothetical protein